MRNNVKGFSAEDIEKNKTMAGICYLIPILPFILMKDSKFIKFHANQILLIILLGIALGLLTILNTALLFSPALRSLGFILNLIFSLLSFVLSIISLINMIAAFQGNAKRIPLIGKITIIKGSNDVDAEEMFEHPILDKMSDNIQNLSMPGSYTICAHCNEKVANGKKFCAKCGTSTPVSKPTTSMNKAAFKCTSCEKEFLETQKFCTDCGRPVEKIPEMAPPKCNQCGLEAEDGVKFCPECGGKIVIEEIKLPICINCHKILENNEKFCPECGGVRGE